MHEPEHYYHSNLIVTRQHVSWTLHNVTELSAQNCWSAFSCTLEVPLGTHRISKWTVSLCQNDDFVYIRPKLISPQNEFLTFQLSLRIGGELTAFTVSELSSKEKEKNQVKFEIGTVQSILSKAKEDQLELGVGLTVFSQDLYETRS